MPIKGAFQAVWQGWKEIPRNEGAWIRGYSLILFLLLGITSAMCPEDARIKEDATIHRIFDNIDSLRYSKSRAEISIPVLYAFPAFDSVEVTKIFEILHRKEKLDPLDSLNAYATMGCPKSQYWTGIAAFFGTNGKKNAQRLYYWWNLSSENGFPIASYNLYKLINQGCSKCLFARDSLKENELLALAVSRGYPPALVESGKRMKFVKWSSAIPLFQRAADSGNGEAMRELATSYSLGGGMKKDVVKAYMWASLAESLNVEHGSDQRKFLEQKVLTKIQIAQAKRQMEQWLSTHPQIRTQASRSEKKADLRGHK